MFKCDIDTASFNGSILAHISCWYYKLSGRTCQNEQSNLIAGALMYGSYLYLFADFAFRRYVFVKKDKGQEDEKTIMKKKNKMI